jgi:tight adherence protein C
MTLLLIIGVLLIGASVALMARAMMLPRIRAAERIGEISAYYGFPAAVAEESTDRRRPLTDALDRLATRLGGAMSPSMRSEEDQLRRMLLSAGMYGTSPGIFLGYRALSAVGLLLAWLWMAPAAGLPSILFLLGIPMMALMGWTLPLVILRSRADRRLDEIDYRLPELIDSLVVTVEAGMGFTGALRMAAREISGPLGDEINLALHEQSLGLTSEASLENMLGRVDTPAMRSFVRSILQGENLGVSIGDIMRSLAVEMRSRRRASAEERAHKAPIKILFPLVFLIFPAMFLILLYPSIRGFSEGFGG